MKDHPKLILKIVLQCFEYSFSIFFCYLFYCYIYMWHCAEHLALWVHCCGVTHVYLWPFWATLGGRASDAVLPKCVILFANVTLLNDAVMSQCCTCIGHMTIYYKRATNASMGLLACCSSIRQV